MGEPFLADPLCTPLKSTSGRLRLPDLVCWSTPPRPFDTPPEWAKTLTPRIFLLSMNLMPNVQLAVKKIHLGHSGIIYAQQQGQLDSEVCLLKGNLVSLRTLTM